MRIRVPARAAAPAPSPPQGRRRTPHCCAARGRPRRALSARAPCARPSDQRVKSPLPHCWTLIESTPVPASAAAPPPPPARGRRQPPLISGASPAAARLARATSARPSHKRVKALAPLLEPDRRGRGCQLAPPPPRPPLPAGGGAPSHRAPTNSPLGGWRVLQRSFGPRPTSASLRPLDRPPAQRHPDLQAHQAGVELVRDELQHVIAPGVGAVGVQLLR